jgi:hypothetical protein
VVFRLIFKNLVWLLCCLLLCSNVYGQVFLNEKFDNGTSISRNWKQVYGFQGSNTWSVNYSRILDNVDTYLFNGTGGTSSSFCMNYSKTLTTIDGSEKITLLVKKSTNYSGVWYQKFKIGSNAACADANNQIILADYNAKVNEDYGTADYGNFCLYSNQNYMQKFNLSFNRTHLRLLVDGVDKCSGTWKAFNDAIPDHSPLNVLFWVYSQNQDGKMYVTDLVVYNESFAGTPAPIPSLSVLFKNTSGAAKALFKEGEGFYGYANFSLSNGSALSGALCNQTFFNVSRESVTARQNFSLCAAGCNYATYSNVSVNMTNSSYLMDAIHFRACNIGPPASGISVTICGQTSTIPAGSIPLCSASSAFFFVNSSACKKKSYISYSLSDGSKEKRITQLGADRFYLKYSVPMVYNATSLKYKTSAETEYYVHGGESYNINCSQGSYKGGVAGSVTIVNKPPIVFLNDFVNDGGTYAFGSVAEFAGGLWNFSASVSDDDLRYVKYTIRNRTGVVVSHTGTIPISHYSIDASVFVGFVGGNPYNFSVYANDTFGNRTYRSAKFNVTDTGPPVCSGLGHELALESVLYNWSVYCSDQYFYSFNVSCDSGYSYYLQDIDAPTYHYSGFMLLPVSGDTLCNFEYCDGHTDKNIRNMAVSVGYDNVTPDVISVVGKDGKIEVLPNVEAKAVRVPVRVAFDGHSLEPSLPLSSVTWKKLPDRYNFCFGFSGEDRYVSIPIPEGCVEAENSPFKGHLVCGATRTWFDFENPQVGVSVGLGGLVLDLENVSDRGSVCFNSVGKFNCVSGVKVIAKGTPITAHRFQSTSDALYFFFLLFLWIALLFGAFVIRGANGRQVYVLAIFELVLGLFLAAEMIKLIAGSQSLAVVTGLTSVVCFAGLTYLNYTSR